MFNLTAAGLVGAAGASSAKGSLGSHHSGPCRTICETKHLNEVGNLGKQGAWKHPLPALGLAKEEGQMKPLLLLQDFSEPLIGCWALPVSKGLE
jgi:hypothetical protein